MTDINGNVVWSATYTAFGEATIDASSTITNNLRFAGQYFDEETGKHYNWNRYYDPKTGRYTQVDPIGFGAGDMNLYRYVGNNAQNLFDPYGLFSWKEFGKGALKTTGYIIGGAAVVVVGGAALVAVGVPAAVITGIGVGIAVIGSLALGWETGQVITGQDISISLNQGMTVREMCDDEWSERLGGAAVGWAAFGAGAKMSRAPNKNKLPYSESRPPYGKNQVETVWKNAKQPDGNVYDPNTGELITWDKTLPRNGQWDMGHKPGFKYSDLLNDYKSGKITKEEFLGRYRKSDNYWPELPKNNRSHRFE